MSLLILSKAMQVAIPPAQKLTLLALADHCTETGEAWPTLVRLARVTGYAISEVKQALLLLDAIGLVKTVRHGGAGPGTPNRYRIDTILLDRLAKGAELRS